MTKRELDINAVTPGELRGIPYTLVIGPAVCDCGRATERLYIHSRQQGKDGQCRFCFGAMWGAKGRGK